MSTPIAAWRTEGEKRRRPLLIALSFVLLWPAASDLRGQESVLRRPAHPNHYVVLVDSSGSAVSPRTKREIFQRTLTQELIPRLYEGGFGEVVPALSPDKDLLTLLHFGVVTGPSRDAYLRLHEYNLLEQTIHPSHVRTRGVRREDLARWILPRDVYQFSFLSWVPQLALVRLQSVGGSFEAHRTFLLVVHDGQPNDHTVLAEHRSIEQFSDERSYAQAEEAVASIQKLYLLSNGRGGAEPAWSLPASERDRRYPIFVEAYEVVARADAELERGAAGLRPFQSLAFQWTRETGDQPQGVMEGELSGELRSWLADFQGVESALRITGPGATADRRTPPGPRFDLPIFWSGPAGCGTRSLSVGLDLKLRTEDPLLGSRTLFYTPATHLAVPPPRICTVIFWARAGALVGGVLLFATLLFYYLKHRLFTTRTRVWLPGQMKPLPVERRGSQAAQALVTPKPGLEALRLELPQTWWQALFTGGAVLTLSSAGPRALWMAGQDATPQLRLPASHRQVSARWEETPNTPTRITLTFRHGRQSSNLTISYPSRGA
jgi:hypothetical protein